MEMDGKMIVSPWMKIGYVLAEMLTTNTNEVNAQWGTPTMSIILNMCMKGYLLR
jgi:hypothetical protein